jgi:hypothetical protein
MPFTPSHAAAVLPFLRTPLPASALVAGSVSPDLPYYLPVELPWETHSALAVVTTDLLLGGLAWAVWHALLAEPTVAAAPRALRARLSGVPLGLTVRLRSVRALAWTVLALVLGAATHVLWDEFTHASRWGTEHLPALADTWGPVEGYRWLQYASSLVGGAVLLLWAAHWWQRTPRVVLPVRPATWPAWAAVTASGAVLAVVGALRAPDLRTAAVAVATWGGGGAIAAAMALSLVWHLRFRPPRRGEND